MEEWEGVEVRPEGDDVICEHYIAPSVEWREGVKVRDGTEVKEKGGKVGRRAGGRRVEEWEARSERGKG